MIEKQFSRYRPIDAVYSEGDPRASFPRENSPLSVTPTPNAPTSQFRDGLAPETSKLVISPEESMADHLAFVKSRESLMLPPQLPSSRSVVADDPTPSAQKSTKLVISPEEGHHLCGVFEKPRSSDLSK